MQGQTEVAAAPGGKGRTPFLILGSALLVYLALTLYTATVTLQRFPNSADEVAYLVSAELFSTGRLSVPSPPDPVFFNINHVLNDGKFYGKYPPGWPFLLMFGLFVGAPCLVKVLFGGLTLALLWSMARRHGSEWAATAVALLLMANPFFVFNSASHYSHSSCLFFIALGLYGALRWWDDPGDLEGAVWAGAGAGMALLIRPFSAVLVLAPAGISMIVATVRSRNWRAWRGLGVSLVLLFGAVKIYCLYNYHQTGNPFLQPFTKYDPVDHPTLPASPVEWWGRAMKFAVPKALDLNWPWLPFSLVVLGGMWFVPSVRREPKVRILFFSGILLSVGYSFYPGDGGISYGPRYTFEALAAIVPLMALVYARYPKVSAYILAVTLAINCTVFVTFTRTMSGIIQEKRTVFEAVKRDRLENAIVFIKAGSGITNPNDLTRNGIRFDGNVLYVADQGNDNVRLQKAFPYRACYRYVLERGPVPGPLVPLPPSP